MKNISVYLIYTLALIGCVAATAQDIQTIPTPKARAFNNTLRFSAGDYDAGDVGRMAGTIHQVSVHYERRIYKNWFTGLGYARWKTISTTYPYIGEIYFPSSQFEYLPEPKIGQLDSRHNFKMLDLYALYKFGDTGIKRHSINIGAGMSYTWGYNSYIAYYYENPDPPFDSYTITESEKANYLGFIPSVSYDYGLFDNRLIVGINYRLRYYIGMPRFQYDAGFHIGLNL